MPNYRRLYIPGGTFFFTVNLLDRRTKLLTGNIDALRAAYGGVAKRRAFETVAISRPAGPSPLRLAIAAGRSLLSAALAAYQIAVFEIASARG